MAWFATVEHTQRAAKPTYMLVCPGLDTDAHTFAICMQVVDATLTYVGIDSGCA